MRQFYLCLLLCSACGCSIQLPTSPGLPPEIQTPSLEEGPPSYLPALEHVASGIVLRDKDTETTTELKETLLFELSRFPRAHAHVDTIYLYPSFPKDLTTSATGLYYAYTKEINIAVEGRSRQGVLRTLYHELGHATWDSLSAQQQTAWQDLFDRRLRESDYSECAGTGLGSKWATLQGNFEEWKRFPSPYAMSHVTEFFAEHQEDAATGDQREYALRYHDEHALMEKQGVLPLDTLALLELPEALTRVPAVLGPPRAPD